MQVYRTDAPIEEATVLDYNEAVAKASELNQSWIAAIAGHTFRHESNAAMGAGFRIACYRPISDQERIDEAAAWLPFIPDEIRWMFEEAIAVANRLLSAQATAQS